MASELAEVSAAALAQRYLLALCVWREARGETVRGQQLVAAVVLNRVADARWPNTITGVVLQPWQFSAFNVQDPNSTRFPLNETEPAWVHCVAAADLARAGSGPDTPATHYHVMGLAPAWADPTKIVTVEGHHVFYAL